MSATQDLIAAALTVRDVMQRGSVPEVYSAVKDLRELCARAMVRPDVAEVERLVNELNHAAYRSGHAAASRAEPRGTDTQRIALLDYVRGVMAERDQFRDAAKMVSAAPQPISAADVPMPEPTAIMYCELSTWRWVEYMRTPEKPGGPHGAQSKDADRVGMRRLCVFAG